MGQKLCYVVFPQEDSTETERLTAAKAIDWAVLLATTSPHEHLFFQMFFYFVCNLVKGWKDSFVYDLAQVQPEWGCGAAPV